MDPQPAVDAFLIQYTILVVNIVLATCVLVLNKASTLNPTNPIKEFSVFR